MKSWVGFLNIFTVACQCIAKRRNARWMTEEIQTSSTLLFSLSPTLIIFLLLLCYKLFPICSFGSGLSTYSNSFILALPIPLVHKFFSQQKNTYSEILKSQLQLHMPSHSYSFANYRSWVPWQSWRYSNMCVHVGNRQDHKGPTI